jgi:hypothetical protein
MVVARKCEECGKPIDIGYIDVPALVGDPKVRPRTVRLHSNGGCLKEYQLKHPLPPSCSTMKV